MATQLQFIIIIIIIIIIASSRYTVDCRYKFAPSLILEFDEYV